MKKVIYLVLFFISFSVFSQSEIDIVGINYSLFTKSDYNNKIYNSATNKINSFINYGHDFDKKTKLFYHISYQNFNIETKTNFFIIPADDFILFPEIPNYSLITVAIGMENKLNNNWNLTNFITFTLADDISSEELSNNNYFRTFSYVKKKKSDDLKYGFGLYFDNVKENISILPILSLELKNEKRGLNLFFPRSLKLWHKLTDKSYFELKTDIDSNNLKFKNFDNLKVEMLSIATNLSYNYIFNNKFKIKTGIGLPYREYEYKFNNSDFKTTQKPAISFNIGFSYVVFQ
jgi:hypothetical protein